MIRYKIRFLGEDSEVTWSDKRKQIVKSDNQELLDFIMRQRSLFKTDGFEYNNGPPIPADKIQTNYSKEYFCRSFVLKLVAISIIGKYD